MEEDVEERSGGTEEDKFHVHHSSSSVPNIRSDEEFTSAFFSLDTPQNLRTDYISIWSP